MSRKDFYHDFVKAALLAAGWTITREPFVLEFFQSKLYIDFAAERIEIDGSLLVIAVEVKNFRLRGDYVNEFEKALGQYQLYREVLTQHGFPHQLFLAVPDAAYLAFFTNQTVSKLVKQQNVKLITYNPDIQRLVQWNP